MRTIASKFHSENPLFFSVWGFRMVFSMIFAILPLYLSQRGISVTAIGFVVGTYGYASFAMDLTSAVFIDQVRKSTLLKAGALGGALVCLGYVVGIPHVFYFVLLQGLLGISLGLFRPASSALIAESVGQHKVGSALAFNNVAYILGGSVGPLLAFYIADKFSYRAVFLIALLLAVGILATLKCILPKVASPPKLDLNFAAHLNGLRHLIFSKKLLIPMALIFLDIVGLRMWLTYLPIFAKEERGLTLVQVGTVISLEAFLYALAQPFWGKIVDRRGISFPARVGLGAAALVGLTPLAQSFGTLLLVYALMGVLNGAGYPAYTKLALTLSGAGERGRTMSLMAASSDIGHVFGPLAGALMIGATGKMENLFYLAVPLSGLALAFTYVFLSTGYPVEKQGAPFEK